MRCLGHLVEDRPVQARAHRAERRPAGPSQRQPGGVLPGRGQRKVSVQGREQRHARPGSLPAQRQHGGLTADRHVQQMHPGQLGHPRRGAQRADPYKATNAIAVGPLRHLGQQPAASHLGQPGRGSTEAQIQQHLVSGKHPANRSRHGEQRARDQSPLQPADTPYRTSRHSRFAPGI